MNPTTIKDAGERKKALCQEILTCCKANGIDATAELLLNLAFTSEEGLRKVCRELSINIDHISK